MPRPVTPFPPDRVWEARRLHERGAPQRVLAEVLGTTQGTVQRRLKEWGWGPAKIRPSRPHLPKFSFLPAPRDVEEADADAADAGGLADRMRRLASRELRRLELCGGTGEEVVRALDALARILKTANALAGGPEERMRPAEDDCGETLEEMREAIARRLDQLAVEERWRVGRQAPEPAEHVGETDAGLPEGPRLAGL